MITFHRLNPEIQIEVRRFFRQVAESGMSTFFHPHPFTAEMADTLCARRGKDQYWALLDGKEMRAYGMLRGWEEGFAIPSLGICVQADSQRNGYGRKMMAHLIESAKAAGAEEIMLKVDRNNERAITLYKKFGFALTPLDDQNLRGRVAL